VSETLRDPKAVTNIDEWNEWRNWWNEASEDELRDEMAGASVVPASSTTPLVTKSFEQRSCKDYGRNLSHKLGQPSRDMELGGRRKKLRSLTS
jgi:hypothetical protein